MINRENQNMKIQTSHLFVRKKYFSHLLLLLILFTLFSCSRVTRQPTSGIYHSVQKGESLKTIARKYSVSRLEIQKANGIYDSMDLDSGMQIIIPGIKKKIAPKPIEPRQSKKLPIRLIWPAQGTISSGYGKRHGRMHSGIDITRDGGKDIRAAAAGVIEFSGRQRGYGKTIIINHGRGITTLYGHNATLYVKKGTRVKRGSVIAKMGSTGTSSGIHLHFEVRLNKKHTNPLRFLPIR